MAESQTTSHHTRFNPLKALALGLTLGVLFLAYTCKTSGYTHHASPGREVRGFKFWDRQDVAFASVMEASVRPNCFHAEPALVTAWEFSLSSQPSTFIVLTEAPRPKVDGWFAVSPRSPPDPSKIKV